MEKATAATETGRHATIPPNTSTSVGCQVIAAATKKDRSCAPDKLRQDKSFCVQITRSN